MREITRRNAGARVRQIFLERIKPATRQGQVLGPDPLKLDTPAGPVRRVRHPK